MKSKIGTEKGGDESLAVGGGRRWVRVARPGVRELDQRGVFQFWGFEGKEMRTGDKRCNLGWEVLGFGVFAYF